MATFQFKVLLPPDIYSSLESSRDVYLIWRLTQFQTPQYLARRAVEERIQYRRTSPINKICRCLFICSWQKRILRDDTQPLRKWQTITSEGFVLFLSSHSVFLCVCVLYLLYISFFPLWYLPVGRIVRWLVELYSKLFRGKKKNLPILPAGSDPLDRNGRMTAKDFYYYFHS